MNAFRLSVLLLSALLSAFATSVPAATTSPPLREIRLASLEWLPYVGPGLEQNGLSMAIATAAAKQFGYVVKIDYFSWNRAMQVGQEDDRFSGYFPAYYTEERARRCHFSAPMGHSTVGLAYLKANPLQWNTSTDLIGMRIGVVAGYSNGAEFDALVKQGKLTIDPSPGDLFNLKKLLAGRVRAVVIDKSVLRYLLLSDPDLIKEQDRIEFHENVLAKLSLHVCFKRTPAGLELQQAFDEALKKMRLDEIEDAYFKKLEDMKLKVK